MRKVPFIFLLILLLFSGLAAGYESDKTGAYGKVVDEEGVPFQGVKVHLFNTTDKRTHAETTTDKDGKWSIDLSAPGRWLLSIEKQGFIKYVRLLEIEEAGRLREKSVLCRPPSIKTRDIRKAINNKEWDLAIDRATIIIEAYYFSEEKKIVEQALYWLAYSQGHLADTFNDLDKIIELKESAVVNLNYLLKIREKNSKWFDDAMILRTRLAEQLFYRGAREYLALIREAEQIEGAEYITIRLAALDALLRNGLVSPDPLMIIVESHRKYSIRIMAVKILVRNKTSEIVMFLWRIYRDKRTPAIVRLAVRQAIGDINIKRFKLDEPAVLN